MTPEQAKQFLVQEFTNHLTGHPFIPGSVESVLADRVSPELDEAVYDLAGEFSTEDANQEDEEAAEGIIGEGESDASEINNGGLNSQLDFLCAHNDEESLKKILREAIREAFQPDEFSANPGK